MAFTPSTARRPLERLFGGRRALVPQGPGDRGEKLESAFARIRSEHGMIAVESDCPGLTVTRLQEAAAALDSADAVVGSAEGGAADYLVGLKRPQAGVFAAGHAVRDRLKAAGLEVFDLPCERRIRTPEDVFEWYAGAQDHDLRTTYPRTWSVLHAMLPPPRFSALEAYVFGEPES